MPDEAEIETSDLQETIDELHKEREEREKEQQQSAWTRWISLSTALLAVVAAVASLQAGSLVNEALIAKNESVLNQARASDQWAYYQAKGVKRNLAAMAADLLNGAPARSGRYATDAKKYHDQQREISNAAKDLEAARDASNRESAALMEQHHIFAYCVTFTQVAIALSAIAALTRRKVVWYFSLLIGVGGLVLFINGYIRSVRHRPAEVSIHRAAHAAIMD